MSKLRTAEWARRFRKKKRNKMPKSQWEQNIVLSLEHGVFLISHNVHIQRRWVIALGREDGVVVLAVHHWPLWDEWQTLLAHLGIEPPQRKMQWTYEEAMKQWAEKEDELRRENFWHTARRMR